MSISRFIPQLDEAVCEVLESMCFLSAEPEPEPMQEPVLLSFGRRLDFDGPFTGSFGVRTSPDAALTIACNLLGFEHDEMTDDLVGDSIAELANMFCGAVLCRIEVKRAFALTKPVEDRTPIPGAGSACHLVRHFQVGGGCLQTWLEIDGAA